MIDPIAVTMGEPAGIGGDISLAAWIGRKSAALPPFFLIDDPDRIGTLARDLGLDVPIAKISAASDAGGAFGNALPVLPLGQSVHSQPGQICDENSALVLQSIDKAVELCRAGQAAGLVTNPIHKETLYRAGFTHPGHTEYLGELCELNDPPVMMMAVEGLRVVPITIHMPLSAAISRLTPELIVRTTVLTENALRRDFGVRSPKLAICGLNPHAGENGTLGREEIDLIGPTIDFLLGQKLSVTGPWPADSIFSAATRTNFDVILCMYHDQALIPVKTLDFFGAVNITIGLPIVRTSPDHGTALDLAGKGKANPQSFIAALRAASEIAANRAKFDADE